ncbi:MAG: hypothetical protein ACREQJ_18180 [Candidatus Binatia bacterium]
MRYAKTLLAVPVLAWALGLAPAQAEVGEDASTLQSEPESVAPGADPSAAPPGKTSASGIEYRSGGVGKEERDALHLVAARYPLKIVLSAGGDAAFMHDATVGVTDKSGKAIFGADGVGPLVFVNLPPGSYTVAVTARGSTKQQSVSLGTDKQTAISFRW